MIQLSLVKLLGGAVPALAAIPAFLPAGRCGDAPDGPRRRGRGSGCPAFWATVVKVELTDIVFAIDSILVGVAMSPKLWVVLTGGILGIVAMRLVIGQLLTVVRRYPPLVDGAFVIIAWVGIKLLVEWAHSREWIAFEIPRWFSLGLIVVIFGGALPLCAASRGPRWMPRQRRALSLQPTTEPRDRPARATAALATLPVT